MSSDDTLMKRRFNVLGRNAPLFYDQPVHLVRGEGVWVEDVDGRRYLDAYNNVPHVRHCHPHVVDAISRLSGRDIEPAHPISARDPWWRTPSA